MLLLLRGVEVEEEGEGGSEGASCECSNHYRKKDWQARPLESVGKIQGCNEAGR